MVTIVLLTQLLQKRADAKLEARLAHAVDVVMDRFWNPEYRLNNEALNHDYERPDDDNEDYIYLGHAIETFWMILHEALRRGDRALFDLAAKRLERHLEVRLGRRLRRLLPGHGGQRILHLRQGAVAPGGGPHRRHDPPRAHPPRVARVVVPGRTFRYVQERFPLKPHGYPMWIMGGDRKVTFRPHTSRKGNYHHPRHLMLNLLAIDRMIARGGRVSDVWQ